MITARERATITTHEIRLVREQGRTLIESFEVAGMSARNQPRDWHDGQAMLALADKLTRIRRAQRGRARLKPRGLHD